MCVYAGDACAFGVLIGFFQIGEGRGVGELVITAHAIYGCKRASHAVVIFYRTVQKGENVYLDDMLEMFLSETIYELVICSSFISPWLLLFALFLPIKWCRICLSVWLIWLVLSTKSTANKVLLVWWKTHCMSHNFFTIKVHLKHLRISNFGIVTSFQYKQDL